jgi:HNH endonuclease
LQRVQDSDLKKGNSNLPEIKTVKEKIAWGYANLAGFQVLLNGAKKPAHFMVHAKLFRGLCDGAMKVTSLYSDERSKMFSDPRCAYCWTMEAKTADHLLPRIEGGSDASANLVKACRTCNSSKGKKDVFAWFREKEVFPPIDVMQRYMKLAWEHHNAEGDIDKDWLNLTVQSPFRLDLLPDSMPSFQEVSLSTFSLDRPTT